MKRTVIAHCWEGFPEYCWYPWVKKELEKLGYEVLVPSFPDTDKPELSKWLPHLQKVVGSPDSELVLIGHSAGSETILRYLETLPTGTQIAAAILVAGFIDDLGYEQLHSFVAEPFDFERIKGAAKKIVAICSDDDPYIPLSHGEVFKEKLGAELIVKHAMKHFSGPVDSETSCTSLPDVVTAVALLG